MYIPMFILILILLPFILVIGFLILSLPIAIFQSIIAHFKHKKEKKLSSLNSPSH